MHRSSSLMTNNYSVRRWLHRTQNLAFNPLRFRLICSKRALSLPDYPRNPKTNSRIRHWSHCGDVTIEKVRVLPEYTRSYSVDLRGIQWIEFTESHLLDSSWLHSLKTLQRALVENFKSRVSKSRFQGHGSDSADSKLEFRAYSNVRIAAWNWWINWKRVVSY